MQTALYPAATFSFAIHLQAILLCIKKSIDKSKVIGAFVRKSYKSLLHLGNWYKLFAGFYSPY